MNAEKVILVTGASSGFGRIIAITLAKEGYTVYGTSRKKTDDFENIKMLVLDVTKNESIKAAISHILTTHNHIDILINNAGMGISGALELATDEEISLQMNTNFIGVIKMCNAVLPHMRKKRNGKIINISSIGGLISVPYQGLYCASKFAIEGYSEALALEVYPFNIKVCLIEPGDFQTNFTTNRSVSEKTLQDADYSKSFVKTMKIIEHAETTGSNPDKLGRIVRKIVKQNNPSFRTKAGPLEQTLLAKCKGCLPDRLLQFALRCFYKISK